MGIIVGLAKKLKTKLLTFVCLRRVKHHGIVYVNGFSRFTSTTQIGTDCHFNGMAIYGNGIAAIGDHFHSGKGCVIMTQNHDFNNGDRLPYGDTYVTKDVVIDDNVWFGMKVMVLPGVHIGEGAVIQAGSVVVSDVDPLDIVGGHPARAFGKRDAEHYFSIRNTQNIPSDSHNKKK